MQNDMLAQLCKNSSWH